MLRDGEGAAVLRGGSSDPRPTRRCTCTAWASRTATSSRRTCCWMSEVCPPPRLPAAFDRFNLNISICFPPRQPEDLRFRPGHRLQAQRARAAAEQDVWHAALRGPRAAAAPRVPCGARGRVGLRRGADCHAGGRWAGGHTGCTWGYEVWGIGEVPGGCIWDA